MPINPHLRDIAVAYELYPGVKLWMMPFTNLRTSEVIAFLVALNGDNQDGFDNAFGLIEGFLVDFECKGKLTARPKAWKVYLEGREGCPELADRRALWRDIGGNFLIGDAQRAFSATRDTTYDAAEEAPEKPEGDTDPLP